MNLRAGVMVWGLCSIGMLGCSAEVGVHEDQATTDSAGTNAAFDYAPAEEGPEAKPAPQEDLSGKGSVSLKYGQTFRRAYTIPPNGFVGCLTTGATAAIDPVLVLYRRRDNAHTDTPTTERALGQTLALNDDYPDQGLNAGFQFTNTSGGSLKVYLMAFAYGGRTGRIQLNCHGIGLSEQVDLAAGSTSIVASSGIARTTNSNGNPWLFAFDAAPLSYQTFWNNDTTTVNRESTVDLAGPNRTIWLVAHGLNSGNTTVTY